MSDAPLVRVCRLLNECRARYLVIGGQACILHGREQDAVDRQRLLALKTLKR